jgi:cation diffusion facilitator family transporter
MASGGKGTVIAALAANGLITATKVFAAVVSGSTAMMAEALHSFADTSNQALLLVGLTKSQKEADEFRPLGYGRETYFYTFLVSLVIFFLGGAFAIYEGVQKLLETEAHPVDPFWAILVLGASIVFESGSMTVAFKEFNEIREGRNFWQVVTQGKNPVVPTVLFEDGAAIIGSGIALAGVFLSTQLKMPWIDGAASVMIGILLSSIGIFLAYESRSLLIGEAATDEDRKKIRAAIESIEEVVKVEELLAPQLGPDEIMVNVAINFQQGLTTQQLEEVIDRIEERIQKAVPSVKRLFIEVESLKKLA